MEQQQMRFSYGSQLAILLGLVGVGLILGQLIVLVMSISVAGVSMEAITKNPEVLQDILLDSKNASFAQIANVVGTFFMFFLPIVLFVFICYRRRLWAGFSRHFNWQQIALGFLIMLMANYLAGPFEDISKNLLAKFPAINAKAMAAEDLYMQAVKSMSNIKGWGQFFVAAFVVALFPAIFEEVFFRGGIQNFFTRWTKQPLIVIVFSSLLFSLIHASYYLFISRFILGMALGLLFYYTKNIWVNIIAHFVNNLLALAALFYTNLNNKAAEFNANELKLPIWSIFITGTILYVLFVLLKKVSKENVNRIAVKENLVFNAGPQIAQQ
jgi:uncharacterized protein